MIVDLILDRRDFEQYNAREFYFACMRYGTTGAEITAAMDYGTEDDVRKALCNYIDENDYNPDIKAYINSRKWINER